MAKDVNGVPAPADADDTPEVSPAAAATAQMRAQARRLQERQQKRQGGPAAGEQPQQK